MEDILSGWKKFCAAAAVITALALLAVSCYGPNDNTPSAPSTTTSYQLSIASNNVRGPVGSEIAAPLGVFVGNAVNARQPNVRVDFTVIEGAADLNPVTAITDTAGIAWTRVTPKLAPGPVSIRATLYLTDHQIILTAHGT